MQNLLKLYPAEILEYLLPVLEISQSQLGQDIFALCQADLKKNGYFVEFGAGDGKYLSNTLLLEQEFGWSGILSEPNRWLFGHLSASRSNANLDSRCVWSVSGDSLEFNAVNDSYFSTISSFSNSDAHSEKRISGQKYSVETISLLDLLTQHNAPNIIDFMSIDTEGSEFEILSNSDFSKYHFKTIAVEHNYTPNRERIFDLLTSVGYQRVHELHSLHDDWYISNF